MMIASHKSNWSNDNITTTNNSNNNNNNFLAGSVFYLGTIKRKSVLSVQLKSKSVLSGRV